MSAKDWCSKLTFAAFKEQGFHVESVEVKGVKGRTKDFMGCFDELAWHPDGRCYLIQSTERKHIQARRKKIDAVLNGKTKRDKEIREGVRKFVECPQFKAEIWAWGCAEGTKLRKMELLVEYIPVQELVDEAPWAFRWQEVIA